MTKHKLDDFRVVNSTEEDRDKVIALYEKAMSQHENNGYQVWKNIDESVIVNDIRNGLQYKIVQNDNIVCIFSIQNRDALMWREKDEGNAVYLHRVVVNTDFKGQKLFAKVLNWTKQYALQNNLNFIRMDTWANNTKLINYYRLFGFEVKEYYTTPDETQIPVQYRNLDVVLLELDLRKEI
jgi:ribosomal protein S18 acetylase RimI-like enzyme